MGRKKFIVATNKNKKIRKREGSLKNIIEHAKIVIK